MTMHNITLQDPHAFAHGVINGILISSLMWGGLFWLVLATWP